MEKCKFFSLKIRIVQDSKFYDYIDKKISAYTELYLFAQWINKYYKHTSMIYYLGYNMDISDQIKIFQGPQNNYEGSIHFNSKGAAQRAINCLGETLIKIALK